MRSAALSLAVATLLAAAIVSADVGHQEGKAESAAAGGKAAVAATKDDEPPVVHPDFKPSTRTAVFVEQFGDDWKQRWSRSEATKKAEGEDSDKANPDLWAYRGEWEVEEATVYPGLKGDRGLVLKTSAAHHAISAPFSTPIDPAGKDLVVQYEVKMQRGLECGGAYLKLLQANEKEDIRAKEFTNETPYTLMFGPDKCGSTNKVHFIFRHKNPKTTEYEEKHLEHAPTARTDKLSTLYTLIVRHDNTYEIRVNNDKVSSGSLLENFNPPVNPPKEIIDQEDKKPADWVNEAKIPDPDARKPDDWDEDALFEIPDLDAKKPDDWYEDEPETIFDSDQVKPDGWNDQEDGEWYPMIPNPKCEKAAGCGKWRTPMKRNPAYKGKWTAPMVDNPAYKGVWKPRMIPNPDYFEDKNPANLSKMSGIGFELWTMQPDIMFDNILIGHDIGEAEAFAEETWRKKYDVESAEEKKAFSHNVKTAEPAGHGPEVQFTQEPKAYIENKIFSALSKVVGVPMEDLKAQRLYILAITMTATALMGMLAYTVLSSVFSPRHVSQTRTTNDLTTDEGEKEDEGEEDQRAVDAAPASEPTVETGAAADSKAKALRAAQDATEVTVKKMELQAGGSRASSTALRNRFSTGAAESADKTADEE